MKKYVSYIAPLLALMMLLTSLSACADSVTETTKPEESRSESVTQSTSETTNATDITTEDECTTSTETEETTESEVSEIISTDAETTSPDETTEIVCEVTTERRTPLLEGKDAAIIEGADKLANGVNA